MSMRPSRRLQLGIDGTSQEQTSRRARLQTSTTINKCVKDVLGPKCKGTLWLDKRGSGPGRFFTGRPKDIPYRRPEVAWWCRLPVFPSPRPRARISAAAPAWPRSFGWRACARACRRATTNPPPLSVHASERRRARRARRPHRQVTPRGHRRSRVPTRRDRRSRRLPREGHAKGKVVVKMG